MSWPLATDFLQKVLDCGCEEHVVGMGFNFNADFVCVEHIVKYIFLHLRVDLIQYLVLFLISTNLLIYRNAHLNFSLVDIKCTIDIHASLSNKLRIVAFMSLSRNILTV